MKRLFRVVLVVLLLGALGAGGYWAYQNQAAPATTSEDNTFTQVATVEQGDLTASLSVVGQLQSVQSADLTFEQMSGTAKVQGLAVVTGHMVTAGQVLATIDPTPYQRALDEAKNSLQEAEEALAELQTPPTDLEIAKSDTAVARVLVATSAQASIWVVVGPIDKLRQPCSYSHFKVVSQPSLHSGTPKGV